MNISPKQLQILERSNEKAIGRGIEKYVNGHLRAMKKQLDDHIICEQAFQKRAEPMLRTFEENNIVKAVIEKDTKKITFYIREVTTVGFFLAGVYTLIKYIFKP